MSANRDGVSDSDMGNSLSFSELRGPNLSTRVAGGQTLGPIRKRQPSPPLSNCCLACSGAQGEWLTEDEAAVWHGKAS